MTAGFTGESPDPITAWLAQTFPYQHVVRADMGADLRRCPILLIDAPNKSFFGHLVELAIGLTLCDQCPYPHLLRCLDHDLATRLLTLAGYRPTTVDVTAYDAWRHNGSTRHPAHIFTVASRLTHVRTLLDELDRHCSNAGDVARDLLKQHPRLLSGRAAEVYHTRAAFRTFWSSYSGGFHGALRSYGPAAAQLSLLGGHRHADFLLGTTLLEVKSGRLDEDRYLDELIWQIVTYALPACYDGQGVTHVAVYAARYQRLLRYRVDALLNRLAGMPVDIAATAAQLAALIRNRPRRRSAA